MFCFGLNIAAVNAQEVNIVSAQDALSPESLSITYEIKLSVLPVGRGQLNATFDGDAYNVDTTLHSDGIFKWLIRSTFNTSAEGIITDGRMRPLSYASIFARHETLRQFVLIGYEDETPFLEASEPSYSQHRQTFPVADEQRVGALDPLHASLRVLMGMTFSQETPCGNRVPIFDGRRRYDLVFSYMGTETIRVLNGEVWDGPVTVCNLHYEEVAGFRPHPEDDELPRPPLVLYIAEIADGQFHIPVRVRATTPFGPLILSARELNIDAEIEAHASSDPQDALGTTPDYDPFE